MNRSSPLAALAVMSALALAACGTTTGDRAASGGLIGAGGGAIIGSMVGAPGVGALIGGAAGATAGTLIPAHEVNLGDPVWRRSHHCVERYDNGRCKAYAHN
jgi:hypothetical protein